MNQAILDDYVDSLGECGIPGCDCVIYKDHKQIFRKIYGYSDSGGTKPLTNAGTYWLYSATKLITCTAVMQLVKKGYSYGLGVRTLIKKEESGAKSPLGEFGWDSAGGAYALIDVQNHLAIFYMQYVHKCGYSSPNQGSYL